MIQVLELSQLDSRLLQRKVIEIESSWLECKKGWIDGTDLRYRFNNEYGADREK